MGLLVIFPLLAIIGMCVFWAENQNKRREGDSERERRAEDAAMAMTCEECGQDGSVKPGRDNLTGYNFRADCTNCNAGYKRKGDEWVADCWTERRIGEA